MQITLKQDKLRRSRVKVQCAEGPTGEGEERFISTQGTISSKDKVIWFWTLVSLTRLFFSIPKGLGSVSQITAFEAALFQRAGCTEKHGLLPSCCAAFCLLFLYQASGQAGLGVCQPREGVIAFSNAWHCVLFVQPSSGEICFVGEWVPWGKGSYSWENFKNLRLFRRNLWYGLGDTVKLFMYRKPCSHGIFLLLSRPNSTPV